MRRWSWILLALVGWTAACDDDDITGVEDPGEGAVYTMNNASTANYVLFFRRGIDGDLILIDSVPTGGRGTGPDQEFGTDPLGSQDALILSEDRRFLFVVDAGSNTIASFRVSQNGLLTFINRVGSGGFMPVSLAQRGDVLYAVNALQGGNISAYRIGDNGTLNPFVGSVQPLSPANPTSPGSIRVSPDRRTLVVTEKATDRLTIYQLGLDGFPGIGRFILSPGRTPCGADFDQAGRYFVAEAFMTVTAPRRQALVNGSTVSSIFFDDRTNATLLEASALTTETGACRVQLSQDGRFLYTANLISGTITGFLIGSDGRLTRLTGDGRTAILAPQSNPTDMATAREFLYVLTPGERGIRVFTMLTDGDLIEEPAAGIIGRLAFSATGLAAY